MKLPRNAKIFRGQLDAAPFAGVTFLLLIFLLLSSKLVTTPGVRINIDLPDVTYHVPGTTNLSVVVAVDIAGQYYYKGVSIAEDKLLTELKAVVKQSKEPLALEIRADKSANVDKAFRLWAIAGEAGFKEALVVAKPPVIPIPADARSAK